MYGMMRSTLYDILNEGLEKAGARIEYRKKLVRVDERKDKVYVEFADGTSAEGDLLVACDGSFPWFEAEVRRPLRREDANVP